MSRQALPRFGGQFLELLGIGGVGVGVTVVFDAIQAGLRWTMNSVCGNVSPASHGAHDANNLMIYMERSIQRRNAPLWDDERTL